MNGKKQHITRVVVYFIVAVLCSAFICMMQEHGSTSIREIVTSVFEQPFSFVVGILLLGVGSLTMFVFGSLELIFKKRALKDSFSGLVDEKLIEELLENSSRGLTQDSYTELNELFVIAVILTENNKDATCKSIESICVSEKVHRDYLGDTFCIIYSEKERTHQSLSSQIKPILANGIGYFNEKKYAQSGLGRVILRTHNSARFYYQGIDYLELVREIVVGAS
ncbi:hypothetical protein [Catenovulum agarivorans]|uniref:hypothetical protein n=1 Tax=Catenovulum agarivorans TaxID=1172192 RepID=UPI00031EC46A|nr:hypothetical protein [Catenovulum agarivorans]